MFSLWDLGFGHTLDIGIWKLDISLSGGDQNIASGISRGTRNRLQEMPGGFKLSSRVAIEHIWHLGRPPIDGELRHASRDVVSRRIEREAAKEIVTHTLANVSEVDAGGDERVLVARRRQRTDRVTLPTIETSLPSGQVFADRQQLLLNVGTELGFRGQTMLTGKTLGQETGARGEAGHANSQPRARSFAHVAGEQSGHPRRMQFLTGQIQFGNDLRRQTSFSESIQDGGSRLLCASRG